MCRFDERDTIFSRMTLQPGTERYDRYYGRRPEKKGVDDSLRTAPDGVFSRRLPEAALVESTFALITRMRDFVRGFEGEYTLPYTPEEGQTPEELTGFLKKTACSYGAVLTGAAATDERYAYSVRGRGQRHDRPVDDLLPHTFIYAFEMSVSEMRTAPGIREAAEVATTYLKVAVPGLAIAAFLRSLGYKAVCHMDGESELVLPPVAVRAGLGQIGRHGLLVNKTYGSRVRLGAVTTDAELVHDGPVDFKLPKVCEVCRKCAELCPVQAIPRGSIIDDYPKQIRSIDHEACFSAWKKFGTDCGVCVSACPYSKVGGGDHSGETPRPGEKDFLKAFMFRK